MYLNVDEIPSKINVNNIDCNITFLNLEDCIAYLIDNCPLMQIPFRTRPNNNNIALVFIAGYTVAIIQSRCFILSI